LAPLELELELLELLGLAPLELELLELDPLLEVDPPAEEFAPLIATVAEVGDPKLASPATAVSAMLNLLPPPFVVMGTAIVLAEASPSFHDSMPLVGV
jgi:hypothetical protein